MTTVLAFSAGPRGCLGKRFAYAESICILALLVRRFVVRLPAEDEAEYAKDGADREAMKRRLLRGIPWATVAPANAIVRLEPYEG